VTERFTVSHRDGTVVVEREGAAEVGHRVRMRGV
jgi:hypothetical protein